MTVNIQKLLKTNINIDVNANTVCKTLKRYGLVFKVKQKKFLLSKKHHEVWLDFVKIEQLRIRIK